MVGHGLVGAGLCVGGHLDGREHFLDLVLDTVNVNIADHDHSLLVGTIPCLIVVAESLGREVVHNLHGADGQTVAILGGGIQIREHTLEDTHLTYVGLTPLLVDHTALLVDLLGIESEVVGPVMENEQTGVLNALAGDGNIRDIVDSLVNTGIGVEIGSETHTDCGQPVAELIAGEVGGAVEAHVLQEVGQTTLMILLESRSDILCDVEVGLSLGILIVTDVIGETVGEFAHAHGRIHRKGGQHGVLTLSLGNTRQQHDHRYDEHCEIDKLFHIEKLSDKLIFFLCDGVFCN